MVAMHGGLWLQLRTEGVVRERARAAVGLLAPIVTVLFLIGGVWVYLGIDGFRIVSQPDLNALPNPLAKEVVRAPGAWFDIYRTMPITMIVPALGLVAPLLVWLLSRAGRPGLGCFASGLALVGVIGTAGLSLFPFVMPSSTNPNSSLTVWDASSSHLTLTVMFWAVVIFLPIVLLYTIWCYYRMWGKVTAKHIEDNTYSAY